ncbi:MAG: Trm112 family protein [Thermofilaceae archaeon]|nr:Trm112 family protein [Thermofilaceae archaeon]
MKFRLMDLLACPYDKTFPLELHVLELRKYEERSSPFKRKPACEIYCSFKGRRVEELKEDPGCDECIKFEVAEGALHCSACGRWYPIMDEIPILLPDEMRDKKEDLDFLKRHTEKLPKHIIEEGKPWNLKSL